MLIQENVHSALIKTGQYFSDHGYLFREFLSGDEKEWSEADKQNVIASLELDEYIGKVIETGVISAKVRSYLNLAFIDGSCVIGGSRGLVFQGTLFDDKEYIDIICFYNIKFFIPIIKVKSMPIVQRIRIRSFSGRKSESSFENTDGSDDGLESEKNEDEVFITETGSVYHTSRNCSHLRLSVKKVDFTGVEELRNLSGGIYYHCEICSSTTNKAIAGTVYITESGARYHLSLECSGLKRSIRVVKLSEVKDYRKCQRCNENMK